jgi:acid stress-induced BolA-like protein IbaG/YrbA
MPLQILSSPPPPPEEIAATLRARIEAALPGALVEVTPQSPGHFSLAVESAAFEGEPRVRQQQLVYAAIRELMEGDAAPVHAIDRMVTRTP